MPGSSKTVIALNGFLGRTTDWKLIPDLVPDGWDFLAVDLWESSRLGDYDVWTKRFAELVRDIQGPRVLLGYSMGGRLALHSLIESPDLFAGAMIVSANPGLVSDEDRRLRRQTDDIWATKFLHEPWAQLMTEWDAQTTLRPPKNPGVDSMTLSRQESEYSRSTLAQVLRTWSLGLQGDLRADISRLEIPIAFVSGEDDVKFLALARAITAQPAEGAREFLTISRAGHRAPWDAPAQFRTVLAKFLSRW